MNATRTRAVRDDPKLDEPVECVFTRRELRDMQAALNIRATRVELGPRARGWRMLANRVGAMAR